MSSLFTKRPYPKRSKQMKRSNISLAIGFVASCPMRCARRSRPISSAELTKRTLERRAMDAAIWGVPIVSFDVMRQGFRDARRITATSCIGRNSQVGRTRRPRRTPLPDMSYSLPTPTMGRSWLRCLRWATPRFSGTLLDAWQVPLVDVAARARTWAREANTCSSPALQR